MVQWFWQKKETLSGLGKLGTVLNDQIGPIASDLDKYVFPLFFLLPLTFMRSFAKSAEDGMDPIRTADREAIQNKIAIWEEVLDSVNDEKRKEIEIKIVAYRELLEMLGSTYGPFRTSGWERERGGHSGSHNPGRSAEEKKPPTRGKSVRDIFPARTSHQPS